MTTSIVEENEISIDEMLFQLCGAISATKNEKDAAILLRDLLSEKESKMIARRLKIAELLIDGDSYEDVQRKLGVSPTTIAHVQEWLKISGEGYRYAVEKTKKKTQKVMKAKKSQKSETYNDSLVSIKKRYPMYYWPEIVLENIINGSSKRQKKKIETVLKEMSKAEMKTPLFKQLDELLRQSSENNGNS